MLDYNLKSKNIMINYLLQEISFTMDDIEKLTDLEIEHYYYEDKESKNEYLDMYNYFTRTL